MNSHQGLNQNQGFSSNTKHLCNICTMSTQRLRRWSNIVKMVYKCFVFTGLVQCSHHFHTSRAASVRLISVAGDHVGGGGSDPGLPRDMCLDHVIVASVLWCVVTRLPVLQVRPRVDHYTTTTVTTTRRFVTTHGLLKVNQGPAWNTRNSHLASTDLDPCMSIQVRQLAGSFTLSVSGLSLPLPSSSTTSREFLSQLLSTCCG